ncbi:hypothetical protein BEQ56_07370 [Anaerolineaceae bacterium oral taxon 439]|nr:hypothetical protein BEQ56_07370 [Anaerolineaceae bacterium oral taxon 439]
MAFDSDDCEKITTAFRIKEMPRTDRPRERIILAGAGSLTNYELLAVLLKTGTSGMGVLEFAEMILRRFGGLSGLDRVTFDQLRQVKGIGEAKAAELIAAIEFGKRIHEATANRESRQIRSAEDVYELVCAKMRSLDHEELWVINVDSKNRVLAIDQLYKGSVNASTIRIAEVFQGAVSRKAMGIILVHNHPSGDPTPSDLDFVVTRNVKEAGRILEIALLDHVVIGAGDYRSIFDLTAD